DALPICEAAAARAVTRLVSRYRYESAKRRGLHGARTRGPARSSRSLHRQPEKHRGAPRTVTPPTNPIILSLESPDATLELVGGKGASLARLAAAHLPAPPGFHITTRAYHRFVNENHLAGAILAAAAQARSEDPASLDGASTQIQSLMAQGAMPGDIAASIRQWVDGLGAGDPAVAVRSSATAEDLPGMSFAGQQDT